MNSEPVSVTAVIIAKNEAEMIANCIETVRWCQEVLVVNNGSDDDTAQIAEAAGARVVAIKTDSFAQLRTQALKYIKTNWVFYLDADERVTPTLAREMQVHIETGSGQALELNRQNIYYGTEFQHGGWQPDYVTRVFEVSSLKEWQGDIHESPVYQGTASTLHTPLVHLSHRNTRDGLLKTLDWTPIEAQLLYEANAPAVTFSTLVRKGVMEFVRRAYLKQGRKDGLEGLIEAVVQAINRVLVYIQLWEKQRTPSLADTYQLLEEQIASEWRAEATGMVKKPRSTAKTK